MIKTDNSGQVVGFSLSDLNNPEAMDIIRGKIKASESRIRNEFMAQTLSLRNEYINRLNNIVCGVHTRPVPWNEATDENEIHEFLKTHPEYQLDYNLELYEEKMLSMGLDPTEGMFRQFPPGTAVLSSGTGRHLAYMEQLKEQEGLNIPDLENFMVGVTKEADPTVDTTTDEELNQMVQNTYLADQYQMQAAIGLPPMLPNGQYNLDALNVPFGCTIPLMEVPKRIYDLTNLQYPRDISAEMQDQSIPYEDRLATYNAMVKYTNEYNEYIKGAWYEENKQALYNQIRALIDQRNTILCSQWTYMQPQVRASWEREINNINNRVQELQMNIPNHPMDAFYRYEQQILEYNYQVQKYNTNKLKYEHYKYEQSVRNNPNMVTFTTVEELIANGCQFDIEKKEWLDKTGRPLNPEHARIYDEMNRIKSQMEINAEAQHRRDEYTEQMFMVNSMIRDCFNHLGYTAEEANEVVDRDPFGMMHDLNYNPYYQTDGTWNSFVQRTNPQMGGNNYDPVSDKDVNDLTPEEFEAYAKRAETLARNARAAAVTPLTTEQILNAQARRGAVGPNGRIRVYNMRSPLTAKLQEINDSRKPGEHKNLMNLFDTYSEAMPAYQYSISHSRPKDLSGFYDHNQFDEAIENYAHKTRISRTSDLLNELDDNQAFAEAMNNGILGLSLPDEMGYNYNKRRVNFDNSILEQMEATNKPFPEGARIKDPEFETYDDRPLKEIQKERYGIAMDRAARLKQYFAPELGGTWDATAVNDNG